MNAIPLINNIPKTNINNEKQLRQEINTSLVALKKEAGTLEGLINEAAQMLVTINNRIATLENDTVKKSDIVDVVQSGNLQPVTSNAVADKISSLDVSSVGGSGKYISAISETDGKISAIATNLATSIASGGTTPPTSGAVYSALSGKANIETGNFSLIFPRSTVQTLSGSYVKIGSVVFANVRVKVTATTVNNDYVNLPSNVPAMDTSKGCFGSWRTNQANGYGTIQNSGTSSIWFIYNNAEYNVGQKAIDSDGTLQIELVYFT